VKLMNEHLTELPRASPDLKALIRRAKLDDAERSSVVAELRGAEQARLEMLRDALEPIFAQVPAQAELFDHGLVPGDKPRLFVDIVSFVEMARDRRCYRFIQDTRGGTIILAESEKIDAMTQEIANYLARRLIEREKVLSVPYFEANSRLSVKGNEEPSGELTPQTPAATVSRPEDRPHKRGVAGWQLLATLLVGAILGAALAYAYKAGQFEHLWPIRW
jgi:hypothetical protein